MWIFQKFEKLKRRIDGERWFLHVSAYHGRISSNVLEDLSSSIVAAAVSTMSSRGNDGVQMYTTLP